MAAATLEKFRLYHLAPHSPVPIPSGLLAWPQRLYVIGSSREMRWFRVRKIDRSEPSDLNVRLTFVTKAYGIAGTPLATLPDAFTPSFTYNCCAGLDS